MFNFNSYSYLRGMWLGQAGEVGWEGWPDKEIVVRINADKFLLRHLLFDRHN